MFGVINSTCSYPRSGREYQYLQPSLRGVNLTCETDSNIRFEQFIKAKSSDWNNIPSDWFEARQEVLPTQPGVNENGDIKDSVDARAVEFDLHADGDEEKIEGKKAEGFPDFGREMLKYWAFKEGCAFVLQFSDLSSLSVHSQSDADHTTDVNLNHGSYGSPPIPVVEAMRALSKQCEESPDHFMRRAWLPLLTKARKGVADIIHAREDEVVLVPNTTHGVNTILSNLQWEKGDVIVICKIGLTQLHTLEPSHWVRKADMILYFARLHDIRRRQPNSQIPSGQIPPNQIRNHQPYIPHFPRIHRG